MMFVRQSSIALLAVLALCSRPAFAQLRCNEDAARAASTASAAAPSAEPSDPRSQLQLLVSQVLGRSKQIGAAHLLKLAAEADLEEARAQRMPTVSVGLGTSRVSVAPELGPKVEGQQSHAGFSITAPLYDSGRITKLTEWRSQLLESARQGKANAEEQLAVQVVTLAMNRSRYQLQSRIYSQYVRRMACLVDALEMITKQDRGRSSELVRAQKSLQQADLSLEQSATSLRQTEVRLRRLAGEELPPIVGMSNVLAELPKLEDIMDDVARGPDVAAADAQARALRSYTESIVAGQRPSVSVSVTGNTIRGVGKQTDWGAGVNVNLPIYIPGADATVTSALRRTQAAEFQRDDLIESKRFRARELHEMATSALDRSRRIADLLRNSERVRASTLEQWQQLGRRSLFDVMSAEGDYYAMRVAHVNTLFDAEQVIALMWSLGRGVMVPLR